MAAEAPSALLSPAPLHFTHMPQCLPNAIEPDPPGAGERARHPQLDALGRPAGKTRWIYYLGVVLLWVTLLEPARLRTHRGQRRFWYRGRQDPELGARGHGASSRGKLILR